MSDVYSLTNTTRTAAEPSSVYRPTTSGNSSGLTSEFRELMSLMLMSMSMNMNSGMSSSSGTDQGMPGMDMNSLMAPLMMQLFEKMLSQQVQTEPEVSVPQGLPIQGDVTQEFHPGHNGRDFGAPVGTAVKATMSGKVTFAGWNDEGYGNLVIVENGPYRTYYAHLSEIPVSVGQTIQAGSLVGLSGNTGNSTGPHLHYEVRKDGQPLDPKLFMS